MSQRSGEGGDQSSEWRPSTSGQTDHLHLPGGDLSDQEDGGGGAEGGQAGGLSYHVM